MAHTGKAGCKLMCMFWGWWNGFLLHIYPSSPSTSIQLYEMPQTTQAMGQTSSMLAETKLRMGGPELWCSVFSCLPMWSWAWHSSVLLFSACSCFQCIFSFCGRDVYVGGYLKSTMSFVRVRSSVGEVFKSHFIHSLEPHPRWSF